MALRLWLVRPDDLLNLQIEAVNLRLDAADPETPALVIQDAAQDAFLVVQFPPQTIVEEAVFESSPIGAPPQDPKRPDPTAGSTPAPTVPLRSRIGGPSRLVFRVPPGRQITYSTAGLLDWTGLELQVAPLADIPPVPSDEDILNAPEVSEPTPLQSSLELPYRLVLSPGREVGWSHLADPTPAADSRGGRSELWHTVLAHVDGIGELRPASHDDPIALRAIWSPDFNPNRFAASDAPQMGRPDPDWDIATGGVLSAMTPSDRHELVILTSAFHGFVKGHINPGPIDEDLYVPGPIEAEQLILSPLGGYLKSRGQWSPPMPYRNRDRFVLDGPARQFDGLVDAVNIAPQRIRPDLLQQAGTPDLLVPRLAPVDLPVHQPPIANPVVANDFAVLQPAQAVDLDWINRVTIRREYGASLNVSEWVHDATLGRDHYVRIVYEGVVHPTGHRAALIKVTERKIREAPGGGPVAFLAQRMFVVIRKPFLDYQPDRAADSTYGRQMPLGSIQLTTLITPDIEMPAPLAGTEYSFVIRVGGAPFRFNAVGHDDGGNRVDFTTALIFVPFSDLTSVAIDNVRAAHLGLGAARACLVPGQRMAFAPPSGAASDNATLVTTEFHLTSDGQGTDPNFRFRPLLLMAGVRLPAVEQLLGRDAPATIAYEHGYLQRGFDADNSSGLFAQIATEAPGPPGIMLPDKIAAPFSADQAGGVATPNLSITALTQHLGPMAGDDLAQIARNEFEPAVFFNDVKSAATLFGSLPLIDLLVGGSLGSEAPTITTTTEPVAGQPNKRLLVATLHWTPSVKDVSVGIVSLNVNDGTTFVINGRVEHSVAFPPDGVPGTVASVFTGELSNFEIDLLDVVAVHFEKFRFTSRSGAKPDVNVALASPPVTFEGDLSFVNELQNFIPPGLFGDGASLDISPTRIKAGFGIALPPIAIGVFALDGVSLNASVELPFADGKPLFDFGVSSREHPFCLTVAFLGGGGFFHLQLDTDGIRMLEAALEFGAAADINLGVASGGVHIMAGIYFAMGKKDGKDYSILDGYLRLGGELSVLGLISISLEFVLSFGYEDGKAAGRATLTVKVEVLFFSASVAITVEKKFGGSGGDPRFADVIETPAVWGDYAAAFA